MESAMAEDLVAEDDPLAHMSTEDIIGSSRLLDDEIRVLKGELQRLNLELESLEDKIKDTQEKIKLNKQLPYLVGNIVETIFLPVVGLVDPDKLKVGDLVGVNKDYYLILDTLPPEYDSRLKAMEVDEKPMEDYNDIGGLEKQKLGIRPPKGVLLYGPPGTGKTLMARACAAQTKATFLKLAGPQLVQMYIGQGAKLVRDAFQLAKEKSPSVCVEAGMLALRRDATEVTHEDFNEGIIQVQGKKKASLNYYA
ncbi:hypothetical protein B296_00048962 [Ensete ventricosum]|uniref:ATPase AAA-type core domain-containing protein n=1 Tax=Ensete ventricosum TaxID=4639 RepID=A0A426YSS7_ENSVE|nr:hypothetical protein B296_00048962 [Ensete ventricosum]